MAITTHASGSQTAVISTEHSLTTAAVVGTFILYVDKTNMAAGDSVEIRCKVKVIAGGAQVVLYTWRFDDAQSADDDAAVSIPISNSLTDASSVEFTLKQVDGTGRVFPWRVDRHA